MDITTYYKVVYKAYWIYTVSTWRIINTGFIKSVTRIINHDSQRYLPSMAGVETSLYRKAWGKQSNVNDVQLCFVLCLELDLGTTRAKITAYVNISHLWQSIHVWPAGVMLTYAVDIGKTPSHPSVKGHLSLKGKSEPFWE